MPSTLKEPTQDQLIVGLKFHPPALALIRGLPLHCPLILRAEPNNAYDPNAIRVILPTATIPQLAFGQINEELLSSGMEIDDLLAQEEWLLGYIPRQVASELREPIGFVGVEDLPAEFIINHAGKPIVRFEDKT